MADQNEEVEVHPPKDFIRIYKSLKKNRIISTAFPLLWQLFCRLEDVQEGLFDILTGLVQESVKTSTMQFWVDKFRKSHFRISDSDTGFSIRGSESKIQIRDDNGLLYEVESLSYPSPQMYTTHLGLGI